MELTDEERIARADFRLIALDETEYWNLPEYAGKILRVECVYLYDAAEQTYCCELTPSHYLIPIESRAVCAEDVSEEDRDRIDQTIRAHDSSEGSYMHCRTVEKLESVRVCMETLDCDSYDHLVEATREYVTCNSLI